MILLSAVVTVLTVGVDRSVERRCGQTPAGGVASQWGGEHRLSSHPGPGFWPQAVVKQCLILHPVSGHKQWSSSVWYYIFYVF